MTLLVLTSGCGGGTNPGNVTGPPPGQFTTVAGNDWQGYASTAELQAASLFSDNSLVTLEQDATFGQVARITQPANCAPGAGGISPQHTGDFQAPLDKAWFRFRVRFSPGWTSAGPEPAGHANSYKLAFILWEGATMRYEIQFTNTSQIQYGMSVGGVTRQETQVTGATNWWGSDGSVMWDGAEWWEFIMYYERFTTTTGRWGIWWRRLTLNRSYVDLPFTWDRWNVTATSGSLPRASRIELGVNKNKCTPTTQYIYWGPYDVVDGSVYPNPFGVGP